MSDIQAKLRMIQEGVYNEDVTTLEEGAGEDEFVFNESDIEPSLMSEVTIALFESEVGVERIAEFLKENADFLLRDKLITEDAVGKSYVVLSPQARRQKAINLMKMRMARAAGDSRYKKAVVARKLLKGYLEDIRKDSRYSKAEAIVRKQQFRIVNNPEASAALQRAKKLKLS